MVQLIPLDIDGRKVMGVRVDLPQTNLIAITTEKGYIMCGALDVALLNERLAHRKIVAGRALGVRSFEDLLQAPLESVTDAAKAIGVVAGMSGRKALEKMF